MSTAKQKPTTAEHTQTAKRFQKKVHKTLGTFLRNVVSLHTQKKSPPQSHLPEENNPLNFNTKPNKTMSQTKKIQRALVSVFHKDGLEEILRTLHAEGVELLSTGGTQSFIESLGIPCKKVEDVTTYPSILGGRVKTLHPKVFGGILGRREHEGDQQQMQQYDIPAIDLVIVDLYPFEDTVASGASEADIIEKIDIGGISLIRAAAKNFNDVIIVPSKAEYKPLLELLQKQGAQSELADRKWFATQAFGVSSHYDTAIHQWFAK